MELIICKDYEEMSRKAASLAADSVRQNPRALLSFPGGDTPLGMVHAFADLVNAGEVDISKARYVSLDEWVGLSDTDEGSCGLFNRTELLGRLQKPFLDAHIIDGAAKDIEAERKALDAYIARYGPLDVSVLGIGMNGHLGFNEDGVDFGLHAHIIPLSDVTKKVMTKYFGEKCHPEYGISQGIAQIMAAKKVVLIANGAHKADILAQAVRGEVTNRVPASVLQNHPNCFVVADEAAAAKL
ncbi:MAG: glucosamine-6-phosphate deaminase [Eubacteriales bacterium]|nr:glucosamine-6-phosphate deaminase [Eubacteriales bacterium]